MGLTALALLCFHGWLPRAIFWLLVARDAAIFLAIWILGRARRKVPIRPTRFGKYATALLAATIVLALVQAARGVRESPAVLAFALVTMVCIAVSWLQYFRWFLELLSEPPQTA